MTATNHFRNSPRPQADVQVEIRQPHTKDRLPIISYTEDVGLGGIFVAGDHHLSPNDIVNVVLSTPSTWNPLKLKAKVAWSRPAQKDAPGGTGLQFIELTESQTLALLDFVNNLDYSR